jgi:predicted nucleotidyltransferase component of viral defense system
MHEAIRQMLRRYECDDLADWLRALREIVQEIALLGLWRGKFFERAAFYGGTALRILYGLDRFSEDMDFSLLQPDKTFDLRRYFGALCKEVEAFGFNARVEEIRRAQTGPVQSAFLKSNTRQSLLVIEAEEQISRQVPRGQVLKIRIEVDTDPPPGFETHTRHVLHPIPFAARTHVLPDLFAGKMHAILCRKWRARVKGRDWYDLVWYAANHPELHLSHLEARMRQSGDWAVDAPLTFDRFRALLSDTIDRLSVNQARDEVEPFVRNPDVLAVWSKSFFREVAERIRAC